MTAERMTTERNTIIDWAKEKPVQAATLGAVAIFMAGDVVECSWGNYTADPVVDRSVEQTLDLHPSSEVNFEIEGVEYTAALPR